MTTQSGPVHSTPGFASDPPGDNLRDQAQELPGRVQEQVQAGTKQAQDRLREQVNQRSTQLGEQVNQQAADLRAVSDALREQGKDGPAQAAERLARYGERAGGYLSNRDADRILADFEDLGRRKPGVVAAGALALGFAASRFLKASSSRRYYQGSSPRTASPTAPGGSDYAYDEPTVGQVPGVAFEPQVGREPDPGYPVGSGV